MSAATAPKNNHVCGICNSPIESQDPAPCPNCNRIFCEKHREKILESEITPDLCSECGTVYREQGGADAMKKFGKLIQKIPTQ